MKRKSLNPDELTAIYALGELTAMRNSYVHKDKIEIKLDPHQNISEHDNESIESEISTKDKCLEECVEFYIEETIKKFRTVCSDSMINVLDPHFDGIIRSVCAISTKSAMTHLKNILTEANFHFLGEDFDKELLLKVEILLKAVAIYYLSLQTLNIHDEIDSVEELLQEYSQYTLFSECSSDAEEAGFLLNFRNYMKKALRIIPPRRNKMLLVHICAILEGSKRSYVKGGTQSSATTRRTIIYEHESGYEKICRPRPYGHRAAKEEASPIIDKSEVVQCSYGAIVRQHMMPKYVKKDKNKRILAAISAAPLPPSAPSSCLLQPPHLPPPVIASANPLMPFHSSPSLFRMDYAYSPMMPQQPSMMTVQYGLSMAVPIFPPYQWVYQSSAPTMYTATPTHQFVQAPPMSARDDLSQWRPLQWQR
jgi:hypothetical protein